MSVFYVLEDPPPATRPRWFCHVGPGFDDVDEAVAAGLAQAETVVVRTLSGTRYYAGVAPRDGPMAHPWPPSEDARRAIDAEYERQEADEARAQGLAQEFEDARDRWLVLHAPQLIGAEVTHECLVVRDVEDSRPIVLQELAPDGTVWAAHDQRGAMSFGSLGEALSGASGLPPDDPWLRAVEAASARTWPGGSTPWRRSSLYVGLGEGEFVHVSPAVNRASITEHGLDWRRMQGRGIAGSDAPEAEGIFLCADRQDAAYFADMRSDPCDVWAVRVDGLWLEGDPGADGGGSDHWVIVPQPISPDRVSLLHPSIRGRRRSDSG